MQVYYDRDADLSVLKGKRAAVLGYGSQGIPASKSSSDCAAAVLPGRRRRTPV